MMLSMVLHLVMNRYYRVVQALEQGMSLHDTDKWYAPFPKNAIMLTLCHR